ncbi:MAG: hypothetical protein HY954_08685 [Deltaproteobacteria bacterium]|nr:hypothetical protein [Deltaproteobacteria bacterium]
MRSALSIFFLSALIIVLCTSVSYATHTETAVISHNLNIELDIEGRKVSGTDTIAIKDGIKEVRLLIRRDSIIEKVELDAKPLDFKAEGLSNGKANEIIVRVPESRESPRAIKVSFSGVFPDAGSARENIKRGVAYVDDGVVGPEGAFLPSSAYWYPQEDNGLPVFEAVVSLPLDYSSVMEGDLAESKIFKDRRIETWKSSRPIDGLDLIAGKYIITKANHKGVDIYTFFFSKDDGLSDIYTTKTKEYLDLYQGLIGPYPFKKFAVVENFLPTGYGMPSFTLLGSSVIRLPFIPDTSLGHEIAHNWWGNSVFMDNSLGNWVEALTTYTADYLYAKRKSPHEALDFRVKKLRGYKNFAGDSGIALKDFNDSTSPASRSVGYNKGMMVFNMLERAIGEEKFKKGLKEFYSDFAFKRASWADIEASFEKASGKDLGWFFGQWVKRGGGPVLALTDVSSQNTENGFEVSFKIRQKSPSYIMDIPVLFKTTGGDVWYEIRIQDEVTDAKFSLPSKPLSVELDPLSENFRMLADAEVPPTLAGFLGDKDGVIVLPNKSRPHEKYLLAADRLSKDYDLEITSDTEIGVKDYLAGASVLILGGPGENSFLWLTGQYLSKRAEITDENFKINGKIYSRTGSVLALAVKNPHIPSKVICFFMGNRDKEAILEAAKRMRYFSESSYLVFTEDGGVEKGTFEGSKVLRYEFGG